jgi:hypothetical protein
MLKTSVKLYGTVKDINDRTDLIPVDVDLEIKQLNSIYGVNFWYYFVKTVDGELVEVYGVKYNNPTLAATLWKLV